MLVVATREVTASVCVLQLQHMDMNVIFMVFLSNGEPQNFVVSALIFYCLRSYFLLVNRQCKPHSKILFYCNTIHFISAMQCDESCESYEPCIPTCPHETCDTLLDPRSPVCTQDACVEGKCRIRLIACIYLILLFNWP